MYKELFLHEFNAGYGLSGGETARVADEHIKVDTRAVFTSLEINIRD